jgi:O-antigen/teichoic acid export membrane protein
VQPNGSAGSSRPGGALSHGWRTAIGTLQFLAVQAVALVLGFAISIALTRGMGPERYGLYAVAVTTLTWVELSISSLFYQPTIKFVAEAERWQELTSALLQVKFAVSVGAALLLAVLAPTLATWLRSPQLAPYLQVLALSLPITGLTGAHRSALVARGAFGRANLPGLLYWLARLLLAVLLLRQGWSVWAGIGALLGASLLELFVARLFVRPSLLHHRSFPLRRFLSYSLPLFLSSMGIRLLTRIDLLLVQALAGAAAAGFYGAAHNLTLIPLGFLGSALSSPLLSTLSQLGRGEHQEEARSIVQVALRFLLCLLPFASLVAGAAAQIVNLMYGAAFLPTAPLLAWLIFGALALTAVGVCETLLTAAGKPGWTLPLTAPLLPAAALAHWLFIPRGGAVSAAAVTTMAAALGALACLTAVVHVWRIRPPFRTAARSMLISIVAFALARSWPLGAVALLLKLTLLALGIVLAFLALGELTTDELHQVLTVLHTLRH